MDTLISHNQAATEQSTYRQSLIDQSVTIKPAPNQTIINQPITNINIGQNPPDQFTDLYNAIIQRIQELGSIKLLVYWIYDRTLTLNHNNKIQSAKLLGITPKALRAHVKRSKE